MLPRLLLFLFSFIHLTANFVPARDADKLPAAATDTINFRKDIKPILDRACISCHGAEKQRAGLRLDDGAKAREGGNSGPIFKPGDSKSSLLIHLVAGLEPERRMPPTKGKELTTQEIAKLRAWIDQGATWPADGKEKVEKVASKHWSFQPIVRPPVPGNNAQHPIDAFVISRLAHEKISPAPQADRLTLLRRLHLDLLGLPPTPDDIQAFLNDIRPDAYERVVERLLASPHFGERWGRHWLDAARYADSDGYEKDTARPFAWRYRNWVIDALNADLSYDRFTIEQLAGDLLPSSTMEQKVATGFHRNTLTNKEGGVDKEQFRVEAVVDRVNTTSRVFLGLTVGCAQCHDHKYDPISHREYFRLFAFFNSDIEKDIPAPTLVHRDKTQAMTLALGPTRKTHVMIRGDFLRPGVEVSPGTLAVLPKLNAKNPSRLDLAKWLVSNDNPLTARVTVNWVWQRFFGRGLVATPEDFGTQGEKPSHPELLDSLAMELMQREWSLKSLCRVIVTSATYRQSSQVREDIAARDPYNILLARQSRQRLEAEVIRDVMLASSGLLVRTIGGPSVRPPQPAGISELTYAGSAKWVESVGADRYRRGLYTWFQRTSPYPLLMTFDAPDANLCVVKREKSNTPLQALTLLNDSVFVECAQSLGRRTRAEAKGDLSERLAYAFRLCTSRTPSKLELQRLISLHQKLLALCRADMAAAKRLVGPVSPGADVAEEATWLMVSRAMLNLDEVVMRE
jgi:mono/diheme cytochrome c family protein